MSPGRHFPGRPPSGPLCPAQMSRPQLSPARTSWEESVTGVGIPICWMENCPVHFWQRDQHSNLSTRQLCSPHLPRWGSQSSAPHLKTATLAQAEAGTQSLVSYWPPNLISDCSQCGFPRIRPRQGFPGMDWGGGAPGKEAREGTDPPSPRGSPWNSEDH